MTNGQWFENRATVDILLKIVESSACPIIELSRFPEKECNRCASYSTCKDCVTQWLSEKRDDGHKIIFKKGK